MTEEDYRWSISRVLLSGEPNSGKTGCSETFGNEGKIVHHLSYPGEGGFNSIPRVPWVKPYVWREDADARASSKAVLDEIRKVSVDIITGEYGPCHAFFGDGIHRFYEYFIDVASGGKFFKGQMQKEDWLVTGQARTAFKEYLKMMKSSPVPVVVFTSWSGYEPDKQGDVFSANKHVYPDLVGKMARDIMGEFSLILSTHSRPALIKGQPPKFWWQLKADTEVHGAAMKVDPMVWSELPMEIDQDWETLESLLLDADVRKKFKSTKR